MKKQILAFERVEGRSLDARRLFNANVVGIMKGGKSSTYSSRSPILGGKKLGQGLEKCVYDSNRSLECKNKPIPNLPSNEVNVVLSRGAYDEEKGAKQMIVRALDPSVVDRVFVTLQDELVCGDMKLPPKCTSEARKASQIILTRSQKGSTSKTFESKQAFGYAVINLVFGLWALHSHGLIHGDVKIAPGANNAVRVGMVYKLIDLGMVMTFDHVREGIEDKTSRPAKELGNMRKYVFWSIGHLYALLHLGDVKDTCKRHNISWERVLQLYFQNIDLAGLMRSLTILVHLNPALDLKPLLQRLYATPQDFQDVRELDARKLVWSSARSISTSMDVGDRGKVNESFLDLPTMYQRIREYCQLDLPPTIQDYGKTSPMRLPTSSK